jgi:MIP family channel proteins
MAADNVNGATQHRPPILDAWVVPLVAEGVGVLALCFAGIGAVMAFSQPLGGEAVTGGNLVGIALAEGLAYGLMVAAAGHITGGLYNPAVTLGLLIVGRLRWQRAAAFVAAQLVGGVIGALLIKASFPTTAVDAVNLGTPAIPDTIATGRGVVAEIVGAFLLMYVIVGTVIDARGPKTIAPLVIGLTITIDILAFGPVTGPTVNPARWFGPAVLQASWDDWWVYWVGPGIGAAIAAILYYYIYLQGQGGT